MGREKIGMGKNWGGERLCGKEDLRRGRGLKKLEKGYVRKKGT